MSIRYAHKYFIHVALSSGGGKDWELTAIYASPNATQRRGIWDNLDEMPIEGACLVMGDFNRVLRSE